jgi:phage gp37-like protein
MKIEQMEDQIIQALSQGIPYLAAAETYAGQFEADAPSLPLRYPLAYAVFSGSTAESPDGLTCRHLIEFTILVAARNLRGGKTPRRGAASEHGAYELVRDVHTTLTNATFGLAIEPLRPIRVYLVHAGHDLAVYGVDFETGEDVTYGPVS